MKLYLSADVLNMVCWWVDVSYGTHWDCRSHTGSVISMGKVVILILSRKQRLNNASFMGAELVGIADALGLIIWVKYFME